MKTFILFIYSLFLPFMILSSARYDLAICTIFQNDAEFLEEWIEFHKLQGVKHFFLYNNNSEDDFLSVLKPYIKNKEVTLISWNHSYPPGDGGKWNQIQCGAYLDCIKKCKKLFQWLAVIDTDEFLFCPNGETLVSFLERQEQEAAICVNWLMFGTSDVYEIPKDSLMIEMLTQRAPLNFPSNLHIKSIVRPNYVENCYNPHIFALKNRYKSVTENGDPCDGCLSSYVSVEQIRINHYWTRTKKYLEEYKIPKRNQMYSAGDATQKMANQLNECQDETILQFVPQLKKNLKQ